MTKDTSGPAFPQPCQAEGYAANSAFGIAGGGVTKREWYAGMALQGMLHATTPDYMHGPCDEALVKRAFVIADQMLAASEQEAKP